VLLVHGWGSRGSRLSSFVPPLLEAGFSAVAFDAPGHGESSGRLSSMPQFVEAVGAIAERSGRMAGIVAHSLGGAVAAITISRGLGARRAVFVAPSARPDRYTVQFAEALDIADPVRRRMETGLEERLRFRWSDLDVLAAARSATTPLLVFHDREDADVPWSDGAAIVEAWPGSRLVSTSGLGHRRIVHDPGVVKEAVEFLANG
jgi:pimeloyl-ACP methyl ester carboxylesterase